ncbi:hypothetical protein Pjdr2_2970 [Paenibacillus sp. JDR-2]|nr:hypothetical protein Pjdr2_2970 [Paenibacillus sp. JDR-2]
MKRTIVSKMLVIALTLSMAAILLSVFALGYLLSKI